jgi:hypothetical protein
LGINIAPQAALKPSWRKLITTLSKLVLSARQIQFESEPCTSVARRRVEGEGGALAHAMDGFAHEVHLIHALSQIPY